MSNANEKQIGGEHYKGVPAGYGPTIIGLIWKLNAARAQALKYILRAGRKGPVIEDLEKAKHLIELEIEFIKSQGA